MKKNYYYILGIKETASLLEIKDAYRRLSKKIHPDTNQGDKFFEDFFKQIQEAYEVLSDSVKKARFDSEFSNQNNNKIVNELKLKISNLEAKIQVQLAAISRLDNEELALNKEIDSLRKKSSQSRENELDKRVTELQRALTIKGQKEVVHERQIKEFSNTIHDLTIKIENSKKAENAFGWGWKVAVALIVFFGITISYGVNSEKSSGSILESSRISENYLEEQNSLLKQKLTKLANGVPFLVEEVDFSNSRKPGQFERIFSSSEVNYIAPRIRVTMLADSVGSEKVFVKYIGPDGDLISNQYYSPSGFTFSDTLNYSPNQEYFYLSGWGSEDGGAYSIGKHSFVIYSHNGKLMGKSHFYIE